MEQPAVKKDPHSNKKTNQPKKKNSDGFFSKGAAICGVALVNLKKLK